MDNTEHSSIASRYQSLSSIRETFLERARESSELTLPFLVPPSGHSDATNTQRRVCSRLAYVKDSKTREKDSIMTPCSSWRDPGLLNINPRENIVMATFYRNVSNVLARPSNSLLTHAGYFQISMIHRTLTRTKDL